jgi:hypothetical protein
VTVSGEIPFNKPLAAAVQLAPIRTLTVHSQFVNGRHLHRAAPAMTRLRRLQFTYPNFTLAARHAATFFGRPELRQLRALYLMGDRNGSGLTDEVARAVLTSRSLENLQELTLIHDFRGLADPLLVELARSPQMARLRRLSLEQSPIGADAMRALGHSLWLKGLEELDLGSCGLDRQGWQMLLSAPAFAGLKRLYLFDAWLRGDDDRPAAHVGRPELEFNPPVPQGALRAELLARFGAGVVDFDSESHRRWFVDAG